MAAAGRAALHAEHRSQARLAKADHRLLADLVERVAESYRGRGFALAGGRGAQGRDQDQFAVRPVLQRVDVVETDLGFVVAIVLDTGGGDPQAGGDFGNGLEGCTLSDRNIRTTISANVVAIVLTRASRYLPLCDRAPYI